MKTNQRQKIVEYIKQFGFITSYQAYIDLGITQLATRIKELMLDREIRKIEKEEMER